MPTKSIAESVLPGLNPYQPNHSISPPEDGDRQIVRQHGCAAIALELAAQARTQNDGASQSDESADRVHDRRSGEIVEAHSQRRENVACRCPWWPASHPDPKPSDR